MHRAPRDKGYVIVVAMLVLFMVTGMGVLAMVTSTTEQSINTNLTDSQTMFFYAQQAVDRVLSHLSYLDGGLFTTYHGLGLPFRTDNCPMTSCASFPTDLPIYPVKVLDSTTNSGNGSRLGIYLLAGSSNSINTNSNILVEAYVNPKDLVGEYDRGFSRPVAITAQVINNVTKKTTVFRARVRPRTMWDYAYFAMNQTPSPRGTSSQNSVKYGSEDCTAASSSWYNCQFVLTHEDAIVGDGYFGNTFYFHNSTSNPISTYFNDWNGSSRAHAKMYVRGFPTMSGEMRWRDNYIFANNKNQTVAGDPSGSTTPKPALRYRSQVKPITMPRIETLLNDNASGATAATYDYRNQADLYLTKPSTVTAGGGSVRRVWKLIFRTDIWANPGSNTNGSPCATNAAYPSGAVRSAITTSIKTQVSSGLAIPNSGSSTACTYSNPTDFLTFPGSMMLYLIPFPTPGSGTTAAIDGNLYLAAMYGNSMGRRDGAMSYAQNTYTGAGTTVRLDGVNSISNMALLQNGFSSSNNGYITRTNTDATHYSNGLWDNSDITGTYKFLPQPARGFTAPGASNAFHGIIFVEGDVMVSGIVRGQLTIFATGNIYLDHEIQYETHPDAIELDAYGDLRQPDMLALIALGNVIIPQSYPGSNAGLDTTYPLVRQNHPYRDDWSDPDSSTGGGSFMPTGYSDTPQLLDDLGNEQVHAVIITYGYTCSGDATGGSGSKSTKFTCTAPDSNYTTTTTSSDILQFRTGFYAQPRTVPTSGQISGYPTLPNGVWPDVTDSPLQNQAGTFDNTGGNDSGKIQIIGAVIQNVAGRLTYDDPSSGGGCCTFANNVSPKNPPPCTCHKVGFSGVTYQYDQRLKFLWPPYPEQLNATQNSGSVLNSVVPFGNAAWEVLSWEQVSDTGGGVSPGNNSW